jgi:hypothetical protein
VLASFIQRGLGQLTAPSPWRMRRAENSAAPARICRSSCTLAVSDMRRMERICNISMKQVRVRSDWAPTVGYEMKFLLMTLPKCVGPSSSRSGPSPLPSPPRWTVSTSVYFARSVTAFSTYRSSVSFQLLVWSLTTALM